MDKKTDFQVGDLVRRINEPNGRFAQVGQYARVISVQPGGVNVRYAGSTYSRETWLIKNTELVSRPITDVSPEETPAMKIETISRTHTTTFEDLPTGQMFKDPDSDCLAYKLCKSYHGYTAMIVQPSGSPSAIAAGGLTTWGEKDPVIPVTKLTVHLP